MTFTPLARQQIAWRLAHDLPDGAYVNLGSGMPLLVAEYLPADREVIFHSENGILGVGPRQRGETIDPYLINAGNMPVTLLDGGAYFHHLDSFHMVRGGHLDISVLGAYQVSIDGDLANWDLPGSGKAPAVGGAMDLAAGARQVFALMNYFARDGQAKLLPACTLPLTGSGCVTTLYTDVAVLDLVDGGARIREIIAGLSPAELQRRSQVSLEVPPGGCGVLDAPVLD